MVFKLWPVRLWFVDIPPDKKYIQVGPFVWTPYWDWFVNPPKNLRHMKWGFWRTRFNKETLKTWVAPKFFFYPMKKHPQAQH